MHNRKLGRTADHRKALLRNLSTDVILKGKIETTEMKAKEVQAVVEKLITVAKEDSLSARRLAASYVRNVSNAEGKTALQVLFGELGPKYKDRKGGYTRVTKLGFRRGDNAPLASIELV